VSELTLLVLIEDCYQQVKFLNQLPLTVLEGSLKAFRENIFSMSGRKQIPNLIYDHIVLEHANEKLEGEAKSDRATMSELVINTQDVRDLKQLASRIYGSLQVVLEFMDKGVKGLLSGDMSSMLLLDIQRSIEKYQRNFTKLTAKMNDLIDKERVVDSQVEVHFKK
jgi:hypothetical protein